MKRKRTRRSMPSMLFWSRGEQRRFIDAVERLVSIVGDLEILWTKKKRVPRPNHTINSIQQGKETDHGQAQ